MLKKSQRSPDYGLDAPGVIRGLLIGGSAALILGYALFREAIHSQTNWALNLGTAVFNAGIGCLIGATLMFASSRYGKFRVRDRMLRRLNLTGGETLLDVGCGHGLLLIGAARRLPHGRAVGIDLWSHVDQAHNSREATLRNAALEGVAGRVEVRDGNMCEMPFPDATFDAVVASLAIHNVPKHDDRRKAIREIARVLKPGGQVALMDFKSVGLYADELQRSALTNVKVSLPSFWTWPPSRTVTARKPLSN